MALDSLLLFCEQMNQIVGTDMNRLFGLEGVSLKKSEIFFDNRKGVSCNSDNSANYSQVWPVGRHILNNILQVL